MKKLLFFTVLILINGCSSYIVNKSFKQMGVYDDYAKVDKLSNNNKAVVFIPMHHIGTKSFYNDVTKKVDSLENLGFYFYTEKVTQTKNDSIAFLKLRKLTGVPFTNKRTDYLALFDSMYDGKIKYKKELIDQPSYKYFGVDSLKSKNVDVTISEIIHYYETKHGEIKLEKCDYETAMNTKSVCKGKSINKKNVDDVILTFRNKHVIDELQKDKQTKIAIIYGAGHFIGIKEELLKLGYK